MRTKTRETYENGVLVATSETAWTRDDYLDAIKGIEGQITDRRVREALLGLPGAIEWLEGKENEIQTLREEM